MREVGDEESIEEGTEIEGEYRESADKIGDEDDKDGEAMDDFVLNPSEYDIAEFGPAVREIENAADLEAILVTRKGGPR